MKVSIRRLSVVVMVTVALASCSSSDTESTASPTTADPASALAASRADQELAARLVSEVPAGFQVQPDSVGDTGPSDLAKAVRDDPNPDAELALQLEGFVRGYQRLWLDPDDNAIIVFLYQFETAAGADADFIRAKGTLAAEGGTPFTVDGLPADRSNAAAASAPGVSAAVVQFTTGVFNVQVVCTGPSSVGLQARASQVAQDQFDRL